MVKAAILHEGNDSNTADKKLISDLLTHLNLDSSSVHFDGFGSKINFFDAKNKKYLALKQLINADKITTPSPKKILP